MKPKIQCVNFEPPENLRHFMKEALREVLQVSPYDSYLVANVSRQMQGYLMTISINYAGGAFKTTARDADLVRVVTQATGNIFSQVRQWWKSRFPQNENEKTDWAGDFSSMWKVFKKNGPSQNAKKPFRVLVVDDDIESVTPLELCLERLGCETFVVSNGYEAIHEIVSNDRIYDVVILDWNMPEMNGGQALLNAQRVITFSPASKNHWENEKLPVITYSSRAREEIDLPECEDFKHVDHWEKPSSYLHLLNKATESFAKLQSSDAD